MSDPGDAARWLAPRLRDAPPELADEVRRLLAAVETDGDATAAGSVPNRLAAAAMSGLEEVLSAAAADRGSRDAALGLLAADAALTCAFEACADLGDDVGALAERLGPRGVLGHRLADAVRSAAGGAAEVS